VICWFFLSRNSSCRRCGRDSAAHSSRPEKTSGVISALARRHDELLVKRDGERQVAFLGVLRRSPPPSRPGRGNADKATPCLSNSLAMSASAGE